MSNSNNSRRAKQAFRAGQADWLNPEFLPAPVCRQLELLLPDKLTSEQKVTFILRCVEIAWLANQSRRASPQAAMRDELAAVAAASRRLLAAMRLLSQDTIDKIEPDAYAAARGLLPASPLSVPIKDALTKNPASFLSTAWDWIDDLERVATLTASRLKPAREDKPELSNGRALVRNVAAAHLELFLVLPPAGQHEWFAGFMAVLGEFLNMQCGPRVVAGALRTLR